MGTAVNVEAVKPMTVVATKTKAEQGFLEAFERAGASLPGDENVTRRRREAIGRFAALGLPTRRLEAWKYTDLRNLLKDTPPLASGWRMSAMRHYVEEGLALSLKQGDASGDWIVFAGGRMVTGNGALSGADKSLAGHLVKRPSWVEAELARAGEADADGAAALNTAFMTDGLVLDIPEGRSFEGPLHLVFMPGEPETAPAGPELAVTRNIVRIGKGVKVTIVESHIATGAASAHASTQTQLVLGDGAEVVHIKLAETRAGDTHLANWIVRLGANAIYRPFQMTAGAGLLRNGLEIAFEGQHAALDLGGTSILTAAGHADTTLVVDHKVPHCTSRELYKAVLSGTSRGVFQGKVIVRPGAQKTDGKQMAQALMLSPEAEFDSKPELEIYADDVVCGHGSTVAEIDEDLLFYCMSRGIPALEARALLAESFIGEAIDKVAAEGLRETLLALAQARLRQVMA